MVARGRLRRRRAEVRGCGGGGPRRRRWRPAAAAVTGDGRGGGESGVGRRRAYGLAGARIGPPGPAAAVVVGATWQRPVGHVAAADVSG